MPKRKNPADHELIEVPISELRGKQANEIISMDISDERATKIADAYFIGDKAVGRRKDIRELFEQKITGAVGKKGKYLTNKLFELVEGVWVVDKFGPHGEVLKVYKQKPDLAAIVYAIDRVLGKPTQKSVTATFSLADLVKKANEQRRSTIESGRGSDPVVDEQSE